MLSLVNIYKTLFNISKLSELTKESSDSFTISLRNYNNTLGIDGDAHDLSLAIYYIFIHLMTFILITRDETGIIRAKREKIGNLIIDTLLIKYIKNFHYNNSSLKPLRFQYYNLLITVKTTDLDTLFKESTSKNYFQVNNTKFYNDLINIQNLSASLDIHFNLRFKSDMKGKKGFGKYYSPKNVINLIIRMLSNITGNHEYPKRVLDPSCGSSLFLISYFMYVVNLVEHQSLNDDIQLELVGVDIDYKSLLTSSLLIELVTNKYLNIKIDFKIKLIHTDYLLEIDEFKDYFDLIIGNPPYIRERNFDKKYRKKLTSYKTFKGKSDLYFAFIEGSYSSLKSKGYLGFLLPRYWIESNFGITLREFIKKNFLLKVLIDFQNAKLFDIGVHSSILIAQKNITKNLSENMFTTILVNKIVDSKNIDRLLSMLEQNEVLEFKETNFYTTFTRLQQDLGEYWIIKQPNKLRLLKKLMSVQSIKLESIATIKEGINTGADKVSINHTRIFREMKDDVGKGIFVVTAEELDQLQLSKEEKNQYIKRWIKGKDIEKWIVTTQNNWLIYFKKGEEINKKIINHLTKYKRILENRAEIKRNSRRKWYEIAWPRKPEIFDTKPKLLIRYKSKKPVIAIDEQGVYTSADFRILLVNKAYDPYVILGLLNSEVIKWILNMQTKKLGAINDYYSYILKKVPIVYPEREVEVEIVERVKKIIQLVTKRNEELLKEQNLVEKIEEEINEIVNDLYSLKEDEKQILVS